MKCEIEQILKEQGQIPETDEPHPAADSIITMQGGSTLAVCEDCAWAMRHATKMAAARPLKKAEPQCEACDKPADVYMAVERLETKELMTVYACKEHMLDPGPLLDW